MVKKQSGDATITQRHDNAIQTEPAEPTVSEAGDGGLYDRHGYITTSVRLTRDVMEALRVAAFHARVNKSEIIRRVIVEYLEKHPE